MNEALRDSYNEIPYKSHAFPQTHPDRLWVLARLFGMTPAALAGCRVLELGCSNGANLIPMAATMPDATFLGIDLSPVQVQEGAARVAELGLTNIELRVADILDVVEALPEFDYIIAHGLFSWVPPPVQEAILRICSTRLARNGVAYISYNTFPGWRMRGTIRDFMLYHTRQFKDPATQIGQARAMLDFMAQSASNDKSAYALQLKTDVEELRRQPDAYLFHDFLAPFNQPVYFHQFVERAAAHKLQYLAESEVATMLPSNFSPNVAETLRKIAPDLVRTEQLMDFLRNRQFRQTLLVHADVPLNRNVDAPVLEGLQVSSIAQPVSSPVDEHSSAKAEFRLPNNVSMSSTTPITKAAFVLMGLRWPASAPFAELCAAARGRLGGALPTAAPDPAKAAEDARTLGSELLQCVAGGVVELRARPAPLSLVVSERPRAWHIARQEARTSVHVTNLRHETITLDEFNRQVLLLLDGEHDRAALIDALSTLVATNALAIQQEGVEVRDPATVRAVLGPAVDQSLATLARAGLYPLQ